MDLLLLILLMILFFFFFEGAFDSVDTPFSFNTMSGFVTRFDDIYDGNNDMSIFEYLLVS